jgi:hypothetical protein
LGTPLERRAFPSVQVAFAWEVEMKAARLMLVPHHVQPDDYLVMRGGERMGRIYKQAGPRFEWLWAILNPSYPERADLQLAGRSGSLDQARRELMGNLAKYNKKEKGELTRPAIQKN